MSLFRKTYYVPLCCDFALYFVDKVYNVIISPVFTSISAFSPESNRDSMFFS